MYYVICPSKILVPNEEKLDNVNIGEIAIVKESLLCTFSNIPCIKHNVYAENPIVLEDTREIINGSVKAYQRKHKDCLLLSYHALHCHLCGAKLA